MVRKVVQFKKVNQMEGENKKMEDVAVKANVINPKGFVKACCEDKLLSNLKESGKRISSLLNISQKDINRAIKEVRKDWR